MRRVHELLLPLLSAAVVLPVRAQHVHPTGPAISDEQATSTLTAEQVRQLLNGEGMGLAKPAETHRYPGPKHLLERAEELVLSAEQKRQITTIREDMLVEAKRLGREIVDAERSLDTAFLSKTITAEGLIQKTAQIAALQGRLRAVHLSAHLASLPLLTPSQIERYYGGK